MTPIINPMYFYWINILGNIKGSIWILIIILAVVAMMVLIALFDDVFEDHIKLKTAIVWWTSLVSITIVLVLSQMFIPSESTMYKMMVAKMATGDNIQEVTQSIKDGVDYLFEKIKGE